MKRQHRPSPRRRSCLFTAGLEKSAHPAGVVAPPMGTLTV
ncbi:hypothetical protein [Azospirillum largimobile]